MSIKGAKNLEIKIALNCTRGALRSNKMFKKDLKDVRS
jgi:hypothetical protein